MTASEREHHLAMFDNVSGILGEERPASGRPS